MTYSRKRPSLRSRSPSFSRHRSACGSSKRIWVVRKMATKKMKIISPKAINVARLSKSNTSLSVSKWSAISDCEHQMRKWATTTTLEHWRDQYLPICRSTLARSKEKNQLAHSNLKPVTKTWSLSRQDLLKRQSSKDRQVCPLSRKKGKLSLRLSSFQHLMLT